MNRYLSTARKVFGAINNNFRGWTSEQRILVIESDDWGSIRVPSNEAYAALEKYGIDVAGCPFLTFDRLEQEDDFDALYSTLRSVRDCDDMPAIVTANFIMSNPDFERIKESGFSQYYHKPFIRQLEEWGRSKEYFAIYGEGVAENLIKAQLHGREHLNVSHWMSFLKNSSPETRFAFDLGVYGISANVTKEKRRNFLAAFDYENEAELNLYILPSLTEAMDLFHKAFGFEAETFIAPNYFWDSKIEATLHQLNVLAIQSARNQRLPLFTATTMNRRCIKRYTGQKNDFGHCYLVRNAIFEPAAVKDKWLHLVDCIRQIEISFLMKRPAIISMHRLNFIGGFSEANRADNLELLKTLLRTVTKRWPDVRFMSSDALAHAILKSKHAINVNGSD